MNSDILWDVDYVYHEIYELLEISSESKFIKIMMDRYLTIKDIRFDNNCALRYACFKGHLKVVEFLMS
jgi:ankyrin repeat protein